MQQSATVADFCTDESWVILSPIEQSIKRKIESVGVPLKDWDIQINYGIKTGYNDAFIIDNAKRAEILQNCANEDERKRTDALIRPILRGRDIKRYSYDWAEKWLINTHNGVKGKIERIHIEDYPAVKAHLDQFWSQISTRADKGDTSYNLRNCAYLEDFSQPKIIWGNLNLQASFAYAEGHIFLNAPSPFIAPGSKYLLGMLNSKVIDFYIRKLGVTRNGGYFEYKPMFVEQAPIPILVAGDKIRTAIEKAIDSEQIQSIEQLVTSIYGLSTDEAQYIDSQYTASLEVID